MALVKVKVTRAFCIDGERVEEGKVVEVEKALAVELAALGKAIEAPAKPSKETKEVVAE